MYFNKVTSTVVSAMFLLLILSSVNFSSVKLVNAATGDLVNYNNNFNMYTSPSDPNKDSAMQNANCVVNFMQTYVYAASSANNCNSAPTPAVPADQAQTPLQGQTPAQGQSYPAAPEGPQTGVSSQGESVGVVKVVDNNTSGGTFAPVQTTSFATNQNNADNDDDDNDKDARDKDNDDDDNDKDARDKDNDDDDNDKDARDKDNDDDNNNNDNNSETKVYNENTVTKQERKLLLTACFERAYDKGDYLSTKEIVKCAENYNS
jgi:hypothetical protein